MNCRVPILSLCLLVTVSILPAAEPPLEVDSALRSRVQEFYQLQMDRKFRQAEQFVANDTKDWYYESRKTDMGSFSITSVQYADDFQSAKVSLKSRIIMTFPGAAPMPIDMPFHTTWKTEDGKWCYYIDQTGFDTPFGRIKPGRVDLKGDPASMLEKISSGALMDGVHAEPATIQMSLSNPEPITVTLRNTLPGPITVQYTPVSPAFHVEIGTQQIDAEQTTTAIITFVQGSKERPEQLTVQVMPIGQVVPIAIEYTK